MPQALPTWQNWIKSTELITLSLLLLYRLLLGPLTTASPPNTPTRHKVDDATAVYRWLLDHGISADHIAFTGDSCGGGLAITTQLRARDLGLPLLAAAMPFSPWVDMEATVESYVTNRDRDAFFSSGLVRGLAGIFLGEGGNPRDPLANPLYADLSGLGPIYIQAAGDEVLLADARRLDEHARKAREITRNKNNIASLPGKLADC